MSEHDHEHGDHGVRFEETDVSTKPVVYSVLALAVFTVLFTAAAHFVFMGLAEREKAASAPPSPLAAQYAAKEPPEPRLQLEPKTDLDVLHAAEDKVLRGWGWVNKDAGTVHVPVKRAMEMLLAKGLPARQGQVPLKMSPRGVAPRQPAEAEGAPDWREGHGSPADHGAHHDDAHGKDAQGAHAGDSHGAHGGH